MLFSIALAPGIVTPPAAHPPHVVQSISAVLHAVTQNGILVCPSLQALRDNLIRLATVAVGPGAQRLQLLATDVAKDIDRYCISPAMLHGGGREINPYHSCVEASNWGGCDAVLASSNVEKQQCIDAGAPPERVVLLDEFAGSAVDAARLRWLAAQRLDNLRESDAVEMVARVVHFADRLVVADKMIGVSAKDGGSHLITHLRGVMYVIDAWARHSPYGGGTVDLEIVTVARGTGARAGFIDPSAARAAITAGMRQLDTSRRIRELVVTLKQDSAPQVFNDRLLASKSRVWGIHHGFDDLGRLSVGNHRRSRPGRRPTRIEPASEALASTLREILALRDA
jgi:hypothetical protein